MTSPDSPAQAHRSVVDQAAADRLPVARAVNRDADAKAAALLSGAGVLAAAGAVLATTCDTSGLLATTAASGAGAALTGGLVMLLLVLLPRGGTPAAWLQVIDPVRELDQVTQIAARKHQLLRHAVMFLLAAVALGAAAASLTLGRSG